MENVDFNHVGMLGFTIYRVCFAKYLDAYITLKVHVSEEKYLESVVDTVH